MIKIIAGVLFLSAIGAYAAGVRFHPEALADYISAAPGQKTSLVRLDLVSGKSLTGNLVEENKDGVRIMMDGASLDFTKAEIAKITPMEEENRGAKRKRALFTYRPEDTIFKGDPPKKQARNSVGVMMRESREAMKAMEADMAREAAQKKRAALERYRETGSWHPNE